jgi:hypothetical protein
MAYFRLLAEHLEFGARVVLDDLSDQQSARLGRQFILELSCNWRPSDNQETFISVGASAFEQHLAYVQEVLTSGVLARPSLTFCLEPGPICHYIPLA